MRCVYFLSEIWVWQYEFPIAILWVDTDWLLIYYSVGVSDTAVSCYFVSLSIQCGLVMPYHVVYVGQHMFRYRLAEHMPGRMWDELTYPLPNFKIQPLQSANGYVISSHSL